jgi:hypothetical protein
VTYGIVLLLDQEAEAKAIALSEMHRHHAKDPDFVLGKETKIPHISLFHIELDDGGLAEAKKRIRVCVDAWNVAEKRSPTAPNLAGELDEIKLFGEWLFWLTPMGEERVADPLYIAHQDLLVYLAPLRSGNVQTSWPMTGRQECMRDTYGYPLALECFNPHVTLGIVRDGLALSGIVRQRWHAAALVIAEIDRLGRVVGIVEKFPFFVP